MHVWRHGRGMNLVNLIQDELCVMSLAETGHINLVSVANLLSHKTKPKNEKKFFFVILL